MTEDLIRTLPRIRRARDWHFYDHRGNRYLDLWQDGGRNLLGHRPEGLLLTLKNTLSPGLMSPVPTKYLAHVPKALAKLFPRREVRVFRHPAALAEAARAWGPGGLWQPFLPVPETPWFEALVPLGPLNLRLGVFDSSREVPPSELLSGFEAAGLLKALGQWDLFQAAAEKEAWESTRWSPWDHPGLQRQGPYFTLKNPAGPWSEIFAYFLAKGFVLSPRPDQASLIPAQYSPGELQAFHRALEEAPWIS